MSTLLSEKIKEIRKVEGFNQKKFADVCELVYGTYRNYEANIRQPNVVALQKICNAFPQYMEYLILNEMRKPATPGQFTPQEKINLDSSSDKYMSTNISKKIKYIRDAEGITQKKLSEC